jgi:hypothetical protein
MANRFTSRDGYVYDNCHGTPIAIERHTGSPRERRRWAQARARWLNRNWARAQKAGR